MHFSADSKTHSYLSGTEYLYPYLIDDVLWEFQTICMHNYYLGRYIGSTPNVGSLMAESLCMLSLMIRDPIDFKFCDNNSTHYSVNPKHIACIYGGGSL